VKTNSSEQDSARAAAFSRRHLHCVRRDLAIVVGLIGAMGFGSPESAYATTATLSPTVTIRVYNYTQASPVLLAGAEREAGLIFAKAGLKVVWFDCSPGHPTTVPQDFCVDQAATDISLRILPVPIRLPETVFGFAVHPDLASVYYARALHLAEHDAAESEAHIILGCAMAHEVGHLLLGSNSHSVSGVMQARWERKHIRQALMGAMLFTPDQGRRLQAATQK